MLAQRKLLILGLLNQSDMHGYMLNAHLGINIPITLKKPTAYNILETLERDNFIKSHEETTGERKRKVYSLTKKGKKEYESLLKTQLSQFIPGEYPSIVSLSFLNDIPMKTALPLLKERKQKIEAYLNQFIKNFSILQDAHKDNPHYTMEFIKRSITLEMNFIMEIITHLEESK